MITGNTAVSSLSRSRDRRRSRPAGINTSRMTRSGLPSDELESRDAVSGRDDVVAARSEHSLEQPTFGATSSTTRIRRRDAQPPAKDSSTARSSSATSTGFER